MCKIHGQYTSGKKYKASKHENMLMLTKKEKKKMEIKAIKIYHFFLSDMQF